MIEAVLFDIDNTLILFDENSFFEAYLKKLTPGFSDLFTTENFRERLVGAIRALKKNRGQTSNMEYYMNHFLRDSGIQKDEIWKRFQRFYSSEFNLLKDRVTVVDGARQLLASIHRKGIRLVAASNPLWPLSIQTLRLAWAGVEDLPYTMITHIENTSYCKPLPEFFLQVSQTIGLTPGKCLMVGNDPLYDMIAGETGMKTYLTTDSRDQGNTSFSLSRKTRNPEGESLPVPDFSGPLSHVGRVLNL